MNVPQLLYPFICRWTSRLLPWTGLFEDKHLCLFPGKHGLIKAFVFDDGLLERALDHVLSFFSRIRLFAAPWTVICQAPLSMEFSR